MHPFFASRKMNTCASQDQDVINIENVHGLCDSERDPPFYPIHVVYQSEVCQANACFFFQKVYHYSWSSEVNYFVGQYTDSLE